MIIDIETTGFLQQGGSIVEVGVVSLNLATGKIDILFDKICRENILTARHREPPFGWIFQNSSLTVEEVRVAEHFENMKETLQKILDSYPEGATAYNRRFDFDFLESRGIFFPKKLPCPMLLATPFCKIAGKRGYKWPSVEEIWRYLFPFTPYREMHRSSDDAFHEALIVHELYKRGIFPGITA